MTILLPNGKQVSISHGQVTTAEKSLGVWSAIDGGDSKHIKENIIGKTTLDQSYAKHTSPGTHGLDSV